MANTDYRLRHTDPHAPAALLKEIVRNAPIFPASLYAACIDAAKLGDAAPDATYASLVRQLPSELGRRVLLHLLALIAEAAQPAHAATSRMTLPNLAIVFSPGILLNPSTDGCVNDWHLLFKGDLFL